MIRFSAFLVVVAVGLLVAGVVTSKLLLVYLAIGVSGVALMALGIGAAVKWRELFGTSRTAASDVAVAGPVPAQAPQEQPEHQGYPRPVAVPAGSAWPPAAPARAGSVWDSAVPPTGMFPAVRPPAPPAPTPEPRAGEPREPDSAVWQWPADSLQAQPARQASPQGHAPTPATPPVPASSSAAPAPAQVPEPAVASEPPSAADQPTAIDRAIVADQPTAIDLPIVADRRSGTGQPPAKESRTRPDLQVPDAPAPADASDRKSVV